MTNHVLCGDGYSFMYLNLSDSAELKHDLI